MCRTLRDSVARADPIDLKKLTRPRARRKVRWPEVFNDLLVGADECVARCSAGKISAGMLGEVRLAVWEYYNVTANHVVALRRHEQSSFWLYDNEDRRPDGYAKFRSTAALLTSIQGAVVRGSVVNGVMVDSGSVVAVVPLRSSLWAGFARSTKAVMNAHRRQRARARAID